MATRVLTEEEARERKAEEEARERKEAIEAWEMRHDLA